MSTRKHRFAASIPLIFAAKITRQAFRCSEEIVEFLFREGGDACGEIDARRAFPDIVSRCNQRNSRQPP